MVPPMSDIITVNGTTSTDPKSRVAAMVKIAMEMAEIAGEDSADAMMTLLVAAAVIGVHARPAPGQTVLGGLTVALPHAVNCAGQWFPASKHRSGH